MNEVIELKNIITWLVRRRKRLLVFGLAAAVIGAAFGWYQWNQDVHDIANRPTYTVRTKLVIKDEVTGKAPVSRDGVPIQASASVLPLLLRSETVETVAAQFSSEQLCAFYNIKDGENLLVTDILTARLGLSIAAGDQVDLYTNIHDRQTGERIIAAVTEQIFSNGQPVPGYLLEVYDTYVTVGYPAPMSSMAVMTIKYAILLGVLGVFGVLFVLVLIYLFSDMLKGKTGLFRYDFPVLGTVKRAAPDSDKDRAVYFSLKTSLRHALGEKTHQAVCLPDTAEKLLTNVPQALFSAFEQSGYRTLLIGIGGEKAPDSAAYSALQAGAALAGDAVSVYMDVEKDLQKTLESEGFRKFLTDQKAAFDYLFLYVGGSRTGEAGLLATLCDAVAPITYRDHSRQNRIAELLTEFSGLDCEIAGLVYAE